MHRTSDSPSLSLSECILKHSKSGSGRVVDPTVLHESRSSWTGGWSMTFFYQHQSSSKMTQKNNKTKQFWSKRVRARVRVCVCACF